MSSDEEFERALLRSAHDDAPEDADSERAWRRLSAALAGAALAGGMVATPSSWALSKASAKWLLLGAVAGSLLTYRAMERRAPAPAPMVTLVAAASAPSVSVAPPSPPVAAPPVIGSASVAALAIARPAAPNTLGAEIAALDDARRMLPDDALAAIARYHQTFAHGHLAPEAEVIALEALAAKGDDANVLLRADRFLARYPAAPQAARVRELRAAAAR